MQTILQNLTTLTQRYMSTYRGNVNYEKYKHFAELMWDDISFDTERVRESLICHVGHLPIIASYLHPYIQHRDEVDLGLALQMLAIHDIWETIVGDVITVDQDRGDQAQIAEDEAARSLLNDEQFALYQEYSHPATLTGRYAKSIDKLAWRLMYTISDPVVEKARYQHFWFSIESMQRYDPYMKRDDFLTKFYEYLTHHINTQQASI